MKAPSKRPSKNFIAALLWHDYWIWSMFDNILTVDGWVESVAIDLHLQTKTHRTPTWLFRWAIEIAEDLLSRGYIKGYKYPLKEGYFVKMSNSNTLDRIGEP